MELLGPKIEDFGEFLKDVPIGDWVAISHDEDYIVAHAPELKEAVRLAKERGEPSPILTRKHEPLPFF